MKLRQSPLERQQISADELKRQLYSRLLNVALIVAAAVTVISFSAYAWFVNNPAAEVSTQQYQVYGSEDPNLGMEIEYAELHDEAIESPDLPANFWRRFDAGVDFKMDPGDYIVFRIKVINNLTTAYEYNIKFGNFTVTLPPGFMDNYTSEVIDAGDYTYDVISGGTSETVKIPHDSFALDTYGAYAYVTDGEGHYVTDTYGDKIMARTESPVTAAYFNSDYFIDRTGENANPNSFIQPLVQALKYKVDTGNTYTFPATQTPEGFSPLDLTNPPTVNGSNSITFDTEINAGGTLTINAAETNVGGGVTNREEYVYFTLWFDPSVTTSANVNFGTIEAPDSKQVTMQNSNGYIGQTLVINRIFVNGAD